MHSFHIEPGANLNRDQLQRLELALREIETAIGNMPVRPRGVRIFDAYVTTNPPRLAQTGNAYVVDFTTDKPDTTEQGDKRRRKRWRRKRER